MVPAIVNPESISSVRGPTFAGINLIEAISLCIHSFRYATRTLSASFYMLSEEHIPAQGEQNNHYPSLNSYSPLTHIASLFLPPSFIVLTGCSL